MKGKCNWEISVCTKPWWDYIHHLDLCIGLLLGSFAFIVWYLDYSWQIRPVSWLLMPWLLYHQVIKYYWPGNRVSLLGKLFYVFTQPLLWSDSFVNLSSLFAHGTLPGWVGSIHYGTCEFNSESTNIFNIRSLQLAQLELSVDCLKLYLLHANWYFWPFPKTNLCFKRDTLWIF